MHLDVRLPIGGMFTLLGVLLMLYGMAADPAIYKRSLGLNVNLWWGLILLLFGGGMLFLAWRAAQRSAPTPVPPPESSANPDRRPPGA